MVEQGGAARLSVVRHRKNQDRTVLKEDSVCLLAVGVSTRGRAMNQDSCSVAHWSSGVDAAKL